MTGRGYRRHRAGVRRALVGIAALWPIALAPVAAALEILILTGPEGSVEHDRIGPKIAEVIRPLAERHAHDVHTIRVLPSSGTRETLERCGAETRTLCLGLARAGVPVDLPEERRPRILNTMLDDACVLFVTRPDRYWNWHDLRGRADEAVFVTHRGADAEGLVARLLDRAPQVRHVGTRWPSDILGAVAREGGGVGVVSAYPDPHHGLLPRALEGEYSVFRLGGPLPAGLAPAFRERHVTVEDGLFSEAVTTAAHCAPMMLVGNDPARLDRDHWRRSDAEDMIEAIEWALATDMQVGPPPDDLDRVSERLSGIGVLAVETTVEAVDLGEQLLRLGIRAVRHSSGKWIVAAGGACVAGTIGGLGATVAVLTGPAVLLIGGAVTLTVGGAEVVCILTARDWRDTAGDRRRARGRRVCPAPSRPTDPRSAPALRGRTGECHSPARLRGDTALNSSVTSLVCVIALLPGPWTASTRHAASGVVPGSPTIPTARRTEPDIRGTRCGGAGLSRGRAPRAKAGGVRACRK